MVDSADLCTSDVLQFRIQVSSGTLFTSNRKSKERGNCGV